MVLLHGWMDVSASFQFMVDALQATGTSTRPTGAAMASPTGKADCYWFPDYLADLDALLDRIQPESPVNLVGHSLGGNVAALYAGARPERVARFANLEGFGMSPTRPEQAPKRYARWLEELRDPPGLRPYEDFRGAGGPPAAGNKRLSQDRAETFSRGTGARKWRAGRGAARRPGAQDRQSGALPL